MEKNHNLIIISQNLLVLINKKVFFYYMFKIQINSISNLFFINKLETLTHIHLLPFKFKLNQAINTK